MGQTGGDQAISGILAVIEALDPGHQPPLPFPEGTEIDAGAARQGLAQPGGGACRVLLLHLQAGEFHGEGAVAVAHLDGGGAAHLQNLGRPGRARGGQQQDRHEGGQEDQSLAPQLGQ